MRFLMFTEVDLHLGGTEKFEPIIIVSSLDRV